MPETVKRSRFTTEVADAVFRPIAVTIPSGTNQTPWFMGAFGGYIGLDLPPMDGIGTLDIKIQVKLTGAADDTADYVRLDALGAALTLSTSDTEPRKYGSSALETMKGFTGGHYEWRIIASANQDTDKLIHIPHRD